MSESPNPSSGSSPGRNVDDKVAESSPDVNTMTNSQVEDGSSSEYNTRSFVGEGMDRFTKLINDNIIAARYGVFATIVLCTVSYIIIITTITTFFAIVHYNIGLRSVCHNPHNS